MRNVIRGTVVLSAMLFGATTPEAAETLAVQTWAGVWETGARAVGDTFAKKYNVDVRYEQQQNTRLGATLSLPIARRHSLRVAFSTGAWVRLGSDFNTFNVTWSYGWGRGF